MYTSYCTFPFSMVLTVLILAHLCSPRLLRRTGATIIEPYDFEGHIPHCTPTCAFLPGMGR